MKLHPIRPDGGAPLSVILHTKRIYLINLLSGRRGCNFIYWPPIIQILRLEILLKHFFEFRSQTYFRLLTRNFQTLVFDSGMWIKLLVRVKDICRQSPILENEELIFSNEAFWKDVKYISFRSARKVLKCLPNWWRFLKSWVLIWIFMMRIVEVSFIFVYSCLILL